MMRKTMLLAVALLTLTAVSLVACGGEDETTPALSDAEQLGGEFAQCMRDRGVEIPDFESGEDAGAASAESQQAFQECGKLAAAAVPEPNPGDQEASADSAQAFAECMREQGVEFPEYDPETGSIGGSGVDPSDPDFIAAQEECAPLMGPLP